VAKVFSDKLSIDKTYHQSVYKIEGNTAVALLLIDNLLDLLLEHQDPGGQISDFHQNHGL
jgi:hypothetical protein